MQFRALYVVRNAFSEKHVMQQFAMLSKDIQLRTLFDARRTFFQKHAINEKWPCARSVVNSVIKNLPAPHSLASGRGLRPADKENPEPTL